MIFIETTVFSRIVQTLLTDEEYRDLQTGNLLPGYGRSHFDGVYLPKGKAGRPDPRPIETSAQDY
jgi:hypothetical protein